MMDESDEMAYIFDDGFKADLYGMYALYPDIFILY